MPLALAAGRGLERDGAIFVGGGRGFGRSRDTVLWLAECDTANLAVIECHVGVAETDDRLTGPIVGFIVTKDFDKPVDVGFVESDFDFIARIIIAAIHDQLWLGIVADGFLGHLLHVQQTGLYEIASSGVRGGVIRCFHESYLSENKTTRF